MLMPPAVHEWQGIAEFFTDLLEQAVRLPNQRAKFGSDEVRRGFNADVSRRARFAAQGKHQPRKATHPGTRC